MGISVADNFKHLSKKFLDDRESFDTLADMKAVSDSDIPEGFETYCKATDKRYKFLSTNSVDANTGKWREVEYGGGGASNFADLSDVNLSSLAEGDAVRYNATSEKWENVAKMGSGEMDDVVTPLPSVQNPYPKYSTNEQIVGEWINGKPIYQKTINLERPTGTTVTSQLTDIYDVDTIISYEGFYVYLNGDGEYIQSVPINVYHAESNGSMRGFLWTCCGLNNTTERRIEIYKQGKNPYDSTNSSFADGKITIRYTKSTD